MQKLCISFGSGDLAAIQTVKWLDWPTFADWLTQGPPEVQDKAARGWYIPAEFDPSYRHSENFVARHAITYDFDHVSIDTWGDAIAAWSETAFAIYTTFSHRAESPRFRVVLPLSRPAGFDEFQAIARKVATDVGIELIARESFVPAQMMFCPTRPLGGQFIAKVNPGAWLDVDAVLAEYADWTDVNSWPRRRDGDAVHAAASEKVNPREKPGIIGEFNRLFSISQAIERFDLPYRRVR
jgi:putative DNA primase/helicase